MLHWLAGAKAPDAANDADSTGPMELPETPAPVFAVRAFKQAIFGTPQTAQTRPRRYSNTDGARARPSEARPVRPGMTRPKSTSDAAAWLKGVETNGPPALSTSPTKGILLTPGTATVKRKNVTFGEQTTAGGEKDKNQSRLPSDCPGKYPSPWQRSTEPEARVDNGAERSRVRGRLTEAFEQAREEESKRKSKSERRAKRSNMDEQMEPELEDAQPESGKFWKREYDTYRANTQVEVKKLIAKQKAAKDFAKTKDDQCIRLADHLRQEQRRADKLEARADELSQQVKELEKLLRLSRMATQKYQDDAAALDRRVLRDPQARSDNGNDQVGAERVDTDDWTCGDLPTNPSPTLANDKARNAADTVQRPSEAVRSKHEREKFLTLDSRSRPRSDGQGKRTDDPWTHAFNSSDLSTARHPDAQSGTRGGRPAVRRNASAAALQTINANMVANRAREEQEPLPGLGRVPTREEASPEGKDTWRDGPLLAPSLPLPSAGRSPGAAISKTGRTGQHDEAVPVPGQHEIKGQITPAGIAARAAAGSQLGEASTRDNAPVLAAAVAAASQPSAVWLSMHTSQAGTANKRVTSLVGKDGKEVGLDRLEAARARIAARGRVAS